MSQPSRRLAREDIRDSHAEIVRLRGALTIPVSGAINGSIHDEGVHLATSDIHFKRILVGIDFSKQAALALKTAIAIGEIFGSEIFLVNAVASFVGGKGQRPILPETISAEIDSAKEEMKQIVASEPRLRGLRLNDYRLRSRNLIAHYVRSTVCLEM
jgi:hypothetical protein